MGYCHTQYGKFVWLPRQGGACWNHIRQFRNICRHLVSSATFNFTMVLAAENKIGNRQCFNNAYRPTNKIQLCKLRQLNKLINDDALFQYYLLEIRCFINIVQQQVIFARNQKQDRFLLKKKKTVLFTDFSLIDGLKDRSVPTPQ